MKIPTETAFWVQETLRGVDGEEWGIIYMASGMTSIPGDSLSHWQLGVDLIYRALVCDLIETYIFIKCDDQESLLREIRVVNPFVRGGGLLWNGTQIHGTERLSGLIKAHFPTDQRDGKLNPTFIEALEQVFAENGVLWSDKPLLPIMPVNVETHASR